jgi:hypothetical protein
MWLGSFFLCLPKECAATDLLINTEQGVSASFPVPVRLVLFIAIPENNAKNSRSAALPFLHYFRVLL